MLSFFSMNILHMGYSSYFALHSLFCFDLISSLKASKCYIAYLNGWLYYGYHRHGETLDRPIDSGFQIWDQPRKFWDLKGWFHFVKKQETRRLDSQIGNVCMHGVYTSMSIESPWTAFVGLDQLRNHGCYSLVFLLLCKVNLQLVTCTYHPFERLILGTIHAPLDRFAWKRRTCKEQ